MREQNRAKLSRLNIRIDYDLKDKIEREAEEAGTGSQGSVPGAGSARDAPAAGTAAPTQTTTPATPFMTP